MAARREGEDEVEQAMTRPLKIGLVLPTPEDWMGGRTARWSDLLAMARRAEAVGFDSLWLVDHFLYEFGEPPQPPHGLWECWSLLAALAAATERVELGTYVVSTGFRNPALLAKMADTVDEISGGRLILGLGAGNHEPEHRSFGYPADHRVSRFEEAIHIIHTLLREGSVDFEGAYYQTRGCELRPRGPRPGGPPILVGAFGERTLAATARYADLWNRSFANRLEEVPAMQARVDAACRRVGRDPATLARTAGLSVVLPGADRSQVDWVRQWRARPGAAAAGSPEELAALLRGYARAGISHVQLFPEPNTVAGVEALAGVLELLDRG